MGDLLFRVLLFLLGTLFLSLGISFVIIYLNLLNMGYSFSFYVHFISRKLECLVVLVGMFFIFLSLRKGEK